MDNGVVVKHLDVRWTYHVWIVIFSLIDVLEGRRQLRAGGCAVQGYVGEDFKNGGQTLRNVDQEENM